MDFFHKKYESLCNMLNHRGETLKNIIHRHMNGNGISLTALAKKAGYDQSTPYRHFERDDLPDHILIRWGKAMDYDMTRDFPHLSEYASVASDNTRGSYSLPKQPENDQIEYWRTQYIRLLERHNALLEDRLCADRD